MDYSEGWASLSRGLSAFHASCLNWSLLPAGGSSGQGSLGNSLPVLSRPNQAVVSRPRRAAGTGSPRGTAQHPSHCSAPLLPPGILAGTFQNGKTSKTISLQELLVRKLACKLLVRTVIIIKLCHSAAAAATAQEQARKPSSAPSPGSCILHRPLTEGIYY